MPDTESKSSSPTPDDPTGNENERIPGMQSLLDNPFLLLFIGVAMPTVFYLIWGIMEIVTLPVSP